MNVEFRESFLRDLRAVKDKSLLARFRAVIESVEQAQGLDEVAGLKNLKGGQQFYRVRVGDYRIGLSVEGDKVAFVLLLNRKEIYRYFP